jgi:replication fork protection complex subunit Tof1/Swi1
VKLLFSKLSNTLYYLQHGDEDITSQPKRPRAAAELEVRPGRGREDQIAVVVATLLDDQKSEALDSMKTVISTALTEMRAWDQATEARRLLNDDETEETAEPSNHLTRTPLSSLANEDITFPDDDMRTTIFKDGKLQLLLKLMGAERIGDRRTSP